MRPFLLPRFFACCPPPFVHETRRATGVTTQPFGSVAIGARARLRQEGTSATRRALGPDRRAVRGPPTLRAIGEPPGLRARAFRRLTHHSLRDCEIAASGSVERRNCFGEPLLISRGPNSDRTHVAIGLQVRGDAGCGLLGRCELCPARRRIEPGMRRARHAGDRGAWPSAISIPRGARRRAHLLGRNALADRRTWANHAVTTMTMPAASAIVPAAAWIAIDESAHADLFTTSSACPQVAMISDRRHSARARRSTSSLTVGSSRAT